MANRQFVECKFRPDDRRAYTYLNEGDRVRVGDVVKVPDRSGDGWQRVTVSGIDLPAPKFECKPILGLAPVEIPEEAPIGNVPTVGRGALVEGFLWRTREGDRVSPVGMETRHLFYSLRMIWNNHARPEEQVGRNVKLYAFPSFYTEAYFEEAITNLADALFKRRDLQPWQRAELEQMAEHTRRRFPEQLALDGGR
jgi:hypothetical protein